MSTGDIKNNLRKLQTEIRLIKYTESVDVPNLSKGVPTSFLPVYHYVFTQYSTAVAEKISAMDIELFGKSDLRFMESVYKVLRDMFKYKPLVTKDQFFSSGFAERKVIMLTEVIAMIRAKKKELQPPSKSATSLRVNSSMDSLNKISFSSKKSEDTRRVSMIESSRAKQVAKESIGRRNRSGKPETVGLTRPSSAPSGRPPRAVAIKHKADVKDHKGAENPDNEGYGGTPSIIRVRPAAVEVVRLPRDGELTCTSTIDKTEKAELTNQVLELYKMIEDVTSRLAFLEEPVAKITSPVGHSSMIQHSTEPPPPNIEVKADIGQIKQQQETILARLVLLENRMAMMEAKMDSPLPVPKEPVSTYSEESPVSIVKNSNKGAFICVESFVHGDKMVKKLHASPQQPIRNLMDFAEPAIPSTELNGKKNAGSASDRSDTPESQASPDTGNSPTQKSDVNSCQYIDESTQFKVERIKNLFNETDGMLKNIGAPNVLMNTSTNHAKDLDADVDELEDNIEN